MSRASRFNSLKHEALRIVRSIELMGDQSSVQSYRSERTSDMQPIASDLLLLKHKRAGVTVLDVNREPLEFLVTNRRGGASATLLDASPSRWQARLREGPV